jgi:AraC-like DNA-binding protein
MLKLNRDIYEILYIGYKNIEQTARSVDMSHRRLILTPFNEKKLPIFIESIGFNPDQEKVNRPDGYPYYHWLQTVKGEGQLTFSNRIVNMTPNSGVFLLPNVEHRYERITTNWETLYVTFSGPILSDLLSSLNLDDSSYFQWEQDAPLSQILFRALDQFSSKIDIFGIDSSTFVYQFLISLHKYGQKDKNTSLQKNTEKIMPLIRWMEDHLSDPNVGLNQLASFLGVSSRYLNTLFKETFGTSPYTYFLYLRIRQAKYLLMKNDRTTIKEIAKRVGFRDSSHFIATFRKSEGMTPEDFRRLY